MKTNSILSKLNTVLILTIMCCLISGCNNSNSVQAHSKNAVFFDTIINVTVYHSSDSESEKILNHCIQLCDYYTQIFDISSPGSDINRINNSAGKPCKVSDDTIKLLEKSLKYSEDSDGKFDITIYSVSSMWDFHNDTNLIPEANNIENALKHVNYKNVIINSQDNTVTLTDKDASIDIGGIAKGYIADSIAGYLQSTDITGAIINIGGDIMTVRTKGNNEKFNIGITDPSGSDSPVCGIELSNMAVATSGTYERKIVSEGKIYHHILDPETGYPVQTDLASTTIISPESVDADTLCTICILLGSEKSVELINSLPNIYGIFITNDNTLITTDGADNYIISR